jgi:hypothetical protein
MWQKNREEYKHIVQFSNTEGTTHPCHEPWKKDIPYTELDVRYLICGAEPMDSTVLIKWNSSVSAYVKAIFIGMQKDFNSVRRCNVSHVVLQL